MSLLLIATFTILSMLALFLKRLFSFSDEDLELYGYVQDICLVFAGTLVILQLIMGSPGSGPYMRAFFPVVDYQQGVMDQRPLAADVDALTKRPCVLTAKEERFKPLSEQKLKELELTP